MATVHERLIALETQIATLAKAEDLTPITDKVTGLEKTVVALQTDLGADPVPKAS